MFRQNVQQREVLTQFRRMFVQVIYARRIRITRSILQKLRISAYPENTRMLRSSESEQKAQITRVLSRSCISLKGIV